ncbi:toll-like receptor 13 [Monodelphis domestica]|uniref:toll-like receptor 13 n=1 Tax=Monodelphis domestica TaxID=13616 RepID=UPI0024E22F69|nr:toll-like receptor 13 [Monodelphis domestica]
MGPKARGMPLKWLWFIVLEFSLLSLVEMYGFRHCTQYKFNIHHVLCVRKNITNLKESIHDLPEYVTHLNLTHNQIQTVPSRSFVNLSNLVDLRLEWNFIWDLGPEAFQGLKNLTLLNLVENKLQSINSSFEGLSSLKTLLLSHNQISWIQENAFVPLINLQYLNLSRNAITTFSNVLAAVQHLPCLEVLDLTYNTIASLDCNPTTLVSLTKLILMKNKLVDLDFSTLSLPNLTTLDVSQNALQNVHLDTLPQVKRLNLSQTCLEVEKLDAKHLQNLIELDLSGITPLPNTKHVNLSAVCHLLQNLPRIETLFFQKNGIDSENIKHLANCTMLVSLDLSHNKDLVHLCNSEFSDMPSLERLDLNSCMLSLVSNMTWDSLQNLTVLDLSRNRLKTFPDFAFAPLRRLQSLSLSRNPITELNNLSFYRLHELKELDLAGCWIVAIDSYSFSQFLSLENLNLRENNLRTLKKNTFLFLKNLQVLTLSYNRLATIEKSAFSGLPKLYKLDLAYNILSDFHPGMFLGLEGLEVLDLSFNKITYETLKSLQPPPFKDLQTLKRLNLEGQINGIQVVPINFFQGLGSLQELLLGKNSKVFLDHLQLDQLPNLTRLDISGTKAGNRGLYLNISLFQKLKQLKSLQLENNNLDSLAPEMFFGLEGLQIFSLRFNNLKIINQNLLQNLKSLMYFDVYGNKLECTCDNGWFKNWSVSTPTVHIPYLGSFQCQQPNTQSLLVGFDTSICNFDTGKICFFCSFSLVLATMVCSWFGTKMISSMRYGIYMFKSLYLAKWHRTEREFVYDAFVSFNAADEEWVYKELVPALEKVGQPTFKLCLHHRDFELGVDIFENIQNAINTSRKTLCIVSNNYLQSEWCRLEVQLASLQMFYDYQDVIILIFLEEIPNYRLSSYHRLRKLVKRQTFITWPEDFQERPLFWARIRNALGNKTVREENARLILTDPLGD